MCLTKRMMLLRTLLLLPVALFLAGCASTGETAPSANNIDSDGNRISSVPWNKPESWETTGSLGGLTR